MESFFFIRLTEVFWIEFHCLNERKMRWKNTRNLLRQLWPCQSETNSWCEERKNIDRRNIEIYKARIYVWKTRWPTSSTLKSMRNHTFQPHLLFIVYYFKLKKNFLTVLALRIHFTGIHKQQINEYHSINEAGVW